MRKLFYFLLTVFILLASLLLWYDQSRKYYCLPDDKCVTVWKRLGGDCYIIPHKYNGVISPQKDYILTKNDEDLDIIWKSDKSILINGGNVKIINQSIDFQMEDYNKGKKINDSLYLYFDGRYHRYKNNVIYMSINIKESYAKGNFENKL